MLEKEKVIACTSENEGSYEGLHGPSCSLGFKACGPELYLGTQGFRFVEEPVEIMDREVKSLKRSKIALVKVRWNSKRGPEFTWEREDYMKSKYPQLFVNRSDE
ncbi:hypothetical protein Tco_0975687 [Tanacetum coccineum]|uniref:Reverse transcriptase domain-containing protein n=1 Tax=Tanacetum coccineum TaxID=301880 RepID=A0ABQ5EF38_9ASTR